ncbi:hypothetical protein IP70_16730 [alpha proteobacterium AAP38]|nr:hypothetical protein IP70_16730 [alpha proteobacterium AAP38]
MANWSPQNWEVPTSFTNFPILELCPAAPKLLAEAGYLSLRDLKAIIARFELDLDVRDQIGVYRHLLELAQSAPWVFPVVETVAAENRGRQSGQKSRKKSVPDHVLLKMPLSKFRLKSRPELHGRLSELLARPVGSDLSLAAFFEYAIISFEVMSKVQSLRSLTDEAIRLFRVRAPGDELRDLLGSLDQVTDWATHADRIIAYVEQNPEKVTALLHDHALRTARALASIASTLTDPVDLLRVGKIFGVAGRLASVLNTPRGEDVLTRILGLGLECDPDKVGDEMLSFLSSALNSGLESSVRRLEHKISELEEEVAELKKSIATAVSGENYKQAGELSARAATEKETLVALVQTKENIFTLVAEVLAGAINDHQAVLLELQILLSETDEVLNTAVTGCKRNEPTDDKGPDDTIEDQAYDHQPSAEPRGPEFHPDALEVSADDGSSPDPIEHGEESKEEEREEDNAGKGVPDREIDSQVTDIYNSEHRLKAAPVPVPALASLIDRGFLAIAFDAASTLEANGYFWPIQAAVLKVAAASRAPLRGYGEEKHRFLEITTTARSAIDSELNSTVLLAALLRPALMDPSLGLRSGLTALCWGSTGTHLRQIAEAIADLDYEFPPDPDELARLSGIQSVPQKQRIAGKLLKWREAASTRTSRWPFATSFMHHVVSDVGLIGTAVAAIASDRPDAMERARHAIDRLSSPAEIDAAAEEFGSRTGRGSSQLYERGREYLERQFDEALGLLHGWIRASTREGGDRQRSEARHRTMISNLDSRLEKASEGLAHDLMRYEGTIEGAVIGWVRRQIDEMSCLLRGEHTPTYPTLDEALKAERDLLPAAIRSTLDASENAFEQFSEVLRTDSVPDPEEAYRRARVEGAFETALRLIDRFGLDCRDDLYKGKASFSDLWIQRIERCEQSLKTLAKIDYKHQREITQHLSWCEIMRSRLEALRTGSDIRDLAEIPSGLEDLDNVVRQIEVNIRQDQMARIEQYRTDQNTDEADALKESLQTLAAGAIEDRIAQLRDGRSAAVFETDLAGLVREFNEKFLNLASSDVWPVTEEVWASAVSAVGPLHIDEGRRTAGLELVGLYRDIAKSITSRAPNRTKLQRLFEEIGYEEVKIHILSPVGRSAWSVDLSGTIRAGATEEWFLPPMFGSRAVGGIRLLLIGPDTLPEMIIKQLSPDIGAILLFAGVIDRAKRHELAQGLRAGAIPALLIDEALIAFAATRREARARTIFECGLPYGRVEPYTTDAGRLPPEMFFGRGEEIRLIMSKTASGCLVYGGRQLGKSALLGHIARTQHAPEDDRIVVSREVRSLGNSEETSEIWAHLALMLSPDVVRPASRTAGEVERDITEWTILKPRGRIVAMFDEADRFMDADTKDDYPELARLKKLMEDTNRAFKVVFAGLHNVQRMYRQPNSPLAHLGEPICIGPLNRTAADKRAAYDLVVKPMRAAGFCFESHEAVEQILSWANYYPSLVQEYMKGLLATLHGTGSGKAYRLTDNGPLWPVETAMLFSHRTFGQIEGRIRDKFHLTLNLDPRYALVAYTLGRLIVEGKEYEARVNGLEPAELLDEARPFWPKASEIPSVAAFEALLEELFDLGILGRVPVPETKRYRYLLGTRQVLTMLGSETDIYHALQAIEEKDPAVTYDRALHRRRFRLRNGAGPDDWGYAPLTDLQIERFFHQDALPVQIVCGLEMLGLSKVGVSLKRIVESGRLPGGPEKGMLVEIAKNSKELRVLVDHKSTAGQLRSVVLFVPDTADQADQVTRWLERQPAVIDRSVLPILILDAADKEMRNFAIARSGETQFLKPWGAEMVRMHLHQNEQMELDTKPIRDTIMAATGGVPVEVTKLIRELRTQSDPISFLTAWHPDIGVPDRLFDAAEGKALKLLDLYDGKDFDFINELVREETGEDIVSVGPDLLAMGLLSDWRPRERRIRRSALGDLISRMMQREHNPPINRV